MTRITRADIALGVLLLVTLTSLFTAHETQERVDRVSTCTAQVTTSLLRAVNERTSYAEASAARTSALETAQRDMLVVMLGQASREERRQALEGYINALQQVQAVEKKARTTRANFPYPTVEEIERCRQ